MSNEVFTTKSQGNKIFNPEDYSEILRLKALKIPNKECNQAFKSLEKYIINRPNLKPIRKEEAFPNERILLLDEIYNQMDTLPSDLSEYIKINNYDIIDYNLKLNFKDLTTDKIFKKIFPDDFDSISAFETIGHIAHLNLRPQHEPYKELIGKVIIEKYSNIKTVVNKIGEIENNFRVPNLEIIAGDNNLIAHVKQHGFMFQLDYSKVYWNSRLEREHDRLVSSFTPNDIIWDAMAGIGPFSIPAANKRCKVYANDLNKCCYEYLKLNIKLNKINPRDIKCYNLDARDFLLHLINKNPLYVNIEEEEIYGNTQVIMNHPTEAMEFLKVFKKSFDRKLWQNKNLPIIHCYTFYKGDDENEIIEKCEMILGSKLGNKVELHNVRDVSPNKQLYCLKFQLTEDIAFI